MTDLFVCFPTHRKLYNLERKYYMFITTHYIVKYVTPCHQSDPNINECVKKAIVQIQPKLRDGLPELMIPPCEPFYVPQVTIRQNAGAISMESVYSSIHMYGVTNFTLQDVRYVTAKNIRLLEFTPKNLHV